jgi:tetratricopeptide (TPR) repeat protein
VARGSDGPARAAAERRRSVAKAMDRGQWQEAVEGLTWLIENAESGSSLLARRAYAYIQCGRPTEAEQDFKTAVDSNNPGPALLLRGVTRSESRDFTGAVADISRYLELVPRPEPSAWYYRGNANCELEQLTPAIADLTKFINSGAELPEDGSAFLTRALADVDLREDLAAASQEREIARRGCALLTLALAHLKAGNAKAFREVRSVIYGGHSRVGDRLTRPLVIWISVIVQDPPDQLQELLKFSREYVQLSPPQSSLPHLLLGAVLYRTGQYAEALKELDLGAPADGASDDPRRLPFLAMTYHRLGHADEGRAWFEKSDRWLHDAAAESLTSGKLSVPPIQHLRLAMQLLQRESRDLLSSGK